MRLRLHQKLWMSKKYMFVVKSGGQKKKCEQYQLQCKQKKLITSAVATCAPRPLVALNLDKFTISQLSISSLQDFFFLILVWLWRKKPGPKVLRFSMTDSWEKLSKLFHALRSRGDRWVTWNMNIHGGNLWCPASLWIIFHYTRLKSSQDWSCQYKFQHGLKTWKRRNNYLRHQVGNLIKSDRESQHLEFKYYAEVVHNFFFMQ